MWDDLSGLALTLYGLALAAVCALSLAFRARIRTDQVPMQWGAGGRPTWYASKTVGLWWSPALMVAIGAIILVTVRTRPEDATTAWTGMIFFSLVMAVTHIVFLRRVHRWAQQQAGG